MSFDQSTSDVFCIHEFEYDPKIHERISEHAKYIDCSANCGCCSSSSSEVEPSSSSSSSWKNCGSPNCTGFVECDPFLCPEGQGLCAAASYLVFDMGPGAGCKGYGCLSCENHFTIFGTTCIGCESISSSSSSVGVGASSSSSIDGLTWTNRTSPLSDANWADVTHGIGLFVAVAYSGTGGNAATSLDGIHWTARTLPEASGWQGVTYGFGAGKFVAVGHNVAASSTNGGGWTSRTIPQGYWRDVTYGGSLFVAVGGEQESPSDSFASSSDGITWTLRPLPLQSSGAWAAVAYGNGIFVAATDTNDNRVAVSTDGVYWTVQALGTDTGGGVAYGNGVFVVPSGTSGAASISADGTNWTISTLPSYASRVAFGDGVFVAVGGGYSATSFDGIVWTQQTLPETQYWAGLTYGEGMFVSMAQNSSIITTAWA